MRYRPEIDGLRALAVIPVVLFHAGVAGFAGGFVGVDVFFVISGFLITSLIVRDLNNGEFSFSHFWERRARRILPALSVVVLATVLIGWVVMLPDDLQRLGTSAVAQSFFASNIVFWRQAGYFGPTASEIPLLHTWSLAVEEQFYLLFPVSIFLVTRYVIKLRWILVAASVFVSFAVSVWGVENSPSAAFYLLPTRAWELGVGSLLALWTVNRSSETPVRFAEIGSALGVAAILFPVFAYDEATSFPGAAALLPVIGTALVIWSNTGSKTRVGQLLAFKPLVYIGLISYSLYLWHWPVIVFWTYPSGSDDLSSAAAVIVIALSFALAYASYRFVETPFRRRRFFARRRAMLGGAVASLMILGAVGLLIRADIGSGIRVSETALAYADASDSRSQRQKDCLLDGRGSADISQPATVCKFGDLEVEPEFAVWGDSHADSLLLGFDSLAHRYGITGWAVANPACPPILDVRQIDEPTCTKDNLDALNLINESKTRTVVLAGSWVGYFRRSDRLEPIEGVEFVPSSRDPETVLVEGLKRTVGKLLEQGLTVWVVRDVPRFDFDPPRRLFNAERFGEDSVSVGITYSEYLEQQRSLTDLFGDLQQIGARVIDLPAVVCDSEFCPVEIDKVVLYKDQHHLSIEGSEYVAPALVPLFESLR